MDRCAPNRWGLRQVHGNVPSIAASPGTVVRSVCSGDSGSSEDGSLGKPPTVEHCAESIDERKPSNEWHVEGYIPIGILVMPPILVRKLVTLEGYLVSTEFPIELAEAIAPFPGQRIFGVGTSEFREFDRAKGGWKVVSYSDIIPEQIPTSA
jgi:hypothetical protein